MSTIHSNDSTLSRYQTQMRLSQIGLEGQQRLQKAKIVCIGAGALASSALLYLAGAGIGHIRICDGDTIALSNLHRQVIYTEEDIGKLKCIIAARRLQQLNHQIQVEPIAEFIHEENVLNYIADCDLVLDATDNFKSKLLLNDASRYLKKTLISASIYQFSGLCTVLAADTACLRCVYECDYLPKRDCEEGVLGMLPGLFGTLQALEVIKLILNLPSSLLGKWLQWETLSATPKTFTLKRNPHCPLCSGKENFSSLWIKVKRASLVKNITVKELAAKLANKEDCFLLDVRSAEEYALFNLGGYLCPLPGLSKKLNELPKNKPIVVLCRSGERSLIAIDLLLDAGFTQLQHLLGGTQAWQQEFC